MSGAGSNHLLTTFADTPGMTGRLVGTIMAANVESRGVYRVFARVLRSGAASAITVRTHVVGSMSTDSIYGPTRTLPLLAGRILVDLGLVAVPSRAEPSHGGYGAELVPSLPSLEIQAARASGAETLGWDYLVFVPADEELCISDTDSLPTTRVYDGPNDIVYGSGGAKVTRAGAIPQLQPGITNQLHIVEPIDAVGTFGTSTVTVKYWPRYLYVAS
jgi:hypothetical protein